MDGHLGRQANGRQTGKEKEKHVSNATQSDNRHFRYLYDIIVKRRKSNLKTLINKLGILLNHTLLAEPSRTVVVCLIVVCKHLLNRMVVTDCCRVP